MNQLTLKEIKVEKISFINDVHVSPQEGSIEVQIGAKISSTVNYSSDNTRCKCTTTVDLIPNPQVNFGATIVVLGVFEYSDGMDHKEVHVSACKKLFPHVQATTAAFMNTVGFPNFVINEPTLDVDSITEGDF